MIFEAAPILASQAPLVAAPADETCLFCGEPVVLELFEVWTDHSFMIETCCEGMHEAVNWEMAEDANESRHRSGAGWIRSLIEKSIGRPMRRIADNDGQLLLDFTLDIQPVVFSEAAEFVEKHHAHCPRPVGWKFGASIWNGHTQIGVVMVGRPVSRLIDQVGDTLEVNRLCLDRTLPDPLRWNACSQLYAWAARETASRGYSRIITYIREDEPGTSLKAAGWDIEAQSAGGSRARKNRPRKEHNKVPKVRWGKRLRPREARVPAVRTPAGLALAA